MTKSPKPALQDNLAMNPTSILFVHFGEEKLRGSELVLLDLLTSLDRSRFKPILLCNSRTMAEQARSVGVVTYQQPMEYFLCADSQPFKMGIWRGQIATARSLALQHNVRILHANSAAPVQWLAVISRSLSLPLLAHLHARYLRRSRFALLLHLATVVVGVSGSVLAGLAEDGAPPSRLRTIPNGVDPARIAIGDGQNLRDILGISGDQLVIGSIGSLIPLKGMDLVLTAFARLSTSKSAHLIIAGSGPEERRLRTMAAEADIAAQVHFIGNVEHPADFYRAIDINVLASHQEAFGLVLVEAALFGVPSVASSVGGTPEVIDAGKTGLLFEDGNVASLVDALTNLSNDVSLRRRMGSAAKQRAESYFTARRMADMFGELYDELVQLPSRKLGWSALARSASPYFRLPRALLRARMTDR